MGDVLLMGPRGSGKSFLVRRLQFLSDEKSLTPFDPLPVTKPTEGLEPTTFKYRGLNLVFKELGGASLSEWETHARAAKAIIYAFDAGDYTMLAQNIVTLNDVISNHHFESKPVLIVLTKCDIPDCVRFNVIDEIIGFDRCLNPSRLSFLETSGVVGVGLSDIFRWAESQMKT